MAVTPRRRFCCDEDLALIGYDGANAAADLARWHEGRLNAATSELIDVLRTEGVNAHEGGIRAWRVVISHRLTADGSAAAGR